MPVDSFSRDHQPQRSHTAMFQGFPIISDQISPEALGVIWRELESVLQQEVIGHIVEFGCYVGTTSLFLRRLLDTHDQTMNRHLHVYDSFEGLPAKTVHDVNAAGIAFQEGKLYASRKELFAQFKQAKLTPPMAHKAWFTDLTVADVPEPIAFAFLDGDFYESIIASLRLVWPCLSQGARILIDDYQRETLPGVECAVHDFFQTKPVTRMHAEHNVLVIECR